MFQHACSSLPLFNASKPHAVAMPIIKHHDNKVNIVSKAAHSKHTTGATFINLTTFSNKQDINYGGSKSNRMTVSWDSNPVK